MAVEETYSYWCNVTYHEMCMGIYSREGEEKRCKCTCHGELDNSWDFPEGQDPGAEKDIPREDKELVCV